MAACRAASRRASSQEATLPASLIRGDSSLI